VVFDPVAKTYVRPGPGGEYAIEWQSQTPYEIFDSLKFDPDRPPAPNSPTPDYVTRKRRPKHKPVEPPRRDSPRPDVEPAEKPIDPKSPAVDVKVPKTIKEHKLPQESPHTTPAAETPAAAGKAKGKGSGKIAFNTVFKGGVSKNGTWRDGDLAKAKAKAEAGPAVAPAAAPVAAPKAPAAPVVAVRQKKTGATKGKAKPKKGGPRRRV
jgi:hypothetical protein